VDVALVRGPVASATARTIVVRREPFVVALPDDHALTPRRIVSLAALRRQPFVFFPRHVAPAYHDIVTAMCRQAGFAPDVRHEAIEYQTMLSLVAAGLGVTVVPISVRNLGRTGVAFRPLSGTKAMAELTLLYRTAQQSHALEAFITIARETVHTKNVSYRSV
jgi:DNA-binding transcriptional LysR family regulator